MAVLTRARAGIRSQPSQTPRPPGTALVQSLSARPAFVSIIPVSHSSSSCRRRMSDPDVTHLPVRIPATDF